MANENRIYVQAKAGQPWRECQCSVNNEKIEFTYNLRQDNHGEIVSVLWLMKNQIYVPSKAGKPRRECQYIINCDQFIDMPICPNQCPSHLSMNTLILNSNLRTHYHFPCT